MNLLVYGSRNFTDRKLIQDVLTEFIRTHDVELVINGGANGADTIGKEVAEELGVNTVTVPARWSKYGLAAGPIRNTQMIVEHKPNFAIGFIMGNRVGRGSQDMSHKLDSAEIEREVYISGELSYA